jgi:hypothetical protein
MSSNGRIPKKVGGKVQGKGVMLQHLAKSVRDLQRAYIKALDSYRPELHYMRGPGPACHAKRSGIAPYAPVGAKTAPALREIANAHA